MKELVVIGAGDFGREVVALVNRINSAASEPQFNLIGFVDDNEMIQGKTVDGLPVLGKVDWINYYPNELYAVCSIGTGRIRKKVIKKINNPKVAFPNIVDPSVIFLGEPKLGVGAIICANSVVSINNSVGDHVIINLSCTLGHDDIIGDYCTINPGSNLSGFVELEECVDIGTGSKIIQHTKVGSNAIVGAGTVIVKDIPSNVTVVGCPAKIIKYHDM